MDNLTREVHNFERFLNGTQKPRNAQIVRQRLNYFIQLLRMNQSYVTLSVTIRSFTCLICSCKVTGANEFLRLRCECMGVVCGIACFRQYVYQYTAGTLQGLEYITCPRCVTGIAKTQVMHAFTEAELVSNWMMVTVAGNGEQGKYVCGIHGDEFEASEIALMTCRRYHQYCRECMQEWIKTKINDGQSDIHCPKTDCPERISQSLIRQLCPELFQRYLTLLVNSTLPQLNSTSDTVFDCPTPDCPNRILVDKRMMDYTCALCTKRYCPQCKSPVHVPMTCQEYFDFLQNELKKHLDQLQMDEAATQAYFQANGIKPCPKCKVPIQKISGCKFVTCLSGICQGTTYLCMDCGKQLPADHANHPCQ